MTETTETLPPLMAVTEPGDDRAAWMEARDGRVTASDINTIATGGRATWLRILDGKLNGSKFKGNASTARGHRREPFLLDWAREFIMPALEPNARLFVHPQQQRIGSTPDGIAGLNDGARLDGSCIGVEVKSHDYGWDSTDIPQDHYDQMQLGMYVLGATRWLYVWEVMGEDGEPTLDDPSYRWVERDDHRIGFLIREAERFLAWWDAGAPATDDLPAHVDDALARWADARDRKKVAEADEKAAEAIVRKHIAETPGAEDDGLKLAGRAAEFVYSVKHGTTLDLDGWAKAEAGSFARWEAAKAAVDRTAEHAGQLYKKPTRSTRLLITATKEEA